MLDFILHNSTLPLLTAFLLGVMTMLSPCPFCSDVTAISYLSKNVQRKRTLFNNGICYVLGKCFSYTVLAVVFICGAQVEGVRHFFEEYGEPVLGPFLILVGVAIAWAAYHESHETHAHNCDAESCSHEHHHKHEHAPHKLIQRLSSSSHPIMSNGLGAFLLGMVFALAFCPYSGLLYFGTLIPLTMLQPVAWSWSMPVMFGLGDALPVMIISFLLSFSIQGIGKINGKLQQIEVWLRRACVVLMIGFGMYLSISIFSGHHHHDHEHESHIHTEHCMEHHH